MIAQYKASEPEIEANYFASALLMPESLFAPRIERTSPSTDLVKSLAGYFDTSLTATAVRYVELVKDYCAVVISEEGKVRWWRASEDLAEHFWIDPGTPLTRNTVAGSVFRGEPVPLAPEALDTTEWLDNPSGIESDTIMEQVIHLERYNQVVSLLWLP